MAKQSSLYVCQQCGVSFPKWSGQCDNCGEWNSLVETAVSTGTKKSGLRSKAAAMTPVKLSEVVGADHSRIKIGISEFDRVLGGGIVPGSVVLIAGEPGIGKSTLLTQLAIRIARNNLTVLYVSGEESPSQIKLRVDRLQQSTSHKQEVALSFLPDTNVDAINATIEKTRPGLVIIDSIQTLRTDDLRSSTGSVSQTRECTSRLIEVAKKLSLPIFLVGHVTKEGAIAGPKVLEHMVDAVLELSGDRQHEYRLLRSSKNRFGANDEVGIFSMDDTGMVEVSNPSDRFLEERQKGVPGSVIVSVLEGTRPMLVEIQSLVVSSSLAVPRRVASGVDQRRVQLLTAVLTKRCSLRLSDKDVYVNVAGGLSIREPAIDFGIAMAIASSALDTPLPVGSVVIGEVGLLGEVRNVSRLKKRIAEAKIQGFKKLVSPEGFPTLTKAIRILLK